MAGERRRFAGDAFHHVAVAAERINVVVEQREVRPVEPRGQPSPGERHADAVAAALAQRPGRCLDARRLAVFRMAGRLAVDLAEALDVVEGERGRARAHP